MRLGPLDVRILRLLQEDARRSFREIAEKVGSTTPTVSARVKALEDVGLLRGYHARLDPRVLGGAAYVLTLTLQPQAAQKALKALAALPGLHAAHLLPGGRIVAHVHLRPPAFSLAHLHQRVADVPGLLTYDAAEVIESHEAPPLDDLPEEVEVPCHQCHGPIQGEPVKGRFGERTHVFCCRHCLGSFRARYEELEKASRDAPVPAKSAARKAPGQGARPPR